MASPHVAGWMALLLSESPDENIPVRTLADMVIRTVTSFSFNDQSMLKTASTLAGIPLSLASSDIPEDLVRGAQPGPLGIHGKTLARNLVYVGSSAHKNGNETEIEDLPATFSTSASTNSTTKSITSILLVIACAVITTAA
jgi:hypothetical protein